jgi:hypothetical protein
LFSAFGRKVLREVFGPIADAEVWQILYNRELYELFEESHVTEVLKIVRLRWAQHVIRMKVKCVKGLRIVMIIVILLQGKRRVGFFCGETRREETTLKTWAQSGG